MREAIYVTLSVVLLSALVLYLTFGSNMKIHLCPKCGAVMHPYLNDKFDEGGCSAESHPIFFCPNDATKIIF